MGHFNIVHSEPYQFVVSIPHVAEMTKDIPVNEYNAVSDVVVIIAVIAAVVIAAVVIAAVVKSFFHKKEGFKVGEMVWVPMYLRHQKMPIASIDANGFWIKSGPHSLMDQIFVSEVHKIRT